jgi:hypothetical protein
MEGAIGLSEAFASEDGASDEGAHESEATVDGAGWAVFFEDEDGAGTAVALVATHFGAGATGVAEEVEEGLVEVSG